MMKIVGLLVLMCACFANAQKFPIRAIALVSGGVLNPTLNQPIIILGEVKFSQETATSSVVAKVNITFFPGDSVLVNQKHGIHVHQFGISSIGQDPSVTCESAGPHWNPLNGKHGSLRDLTGHGGDLGNAPVMPVNGVIQTEIITSKISLHGKDSIIGRSVVLHEKEDDLGLGNSPMSPKTGNSGSKIACGTIGIMP